MNAVNPMIAILQRCILKKGTACVLAFIMLASAAIFFSAPAEAEANPPGFPLYSWGQNTIGQLGRPSTVANPANRPAKVVDSDGVARDRWIASSSASGGSWAISTSGHLYAWGTVWNADQMGQGGVQPPAAFLEGNNIVRPMRVGVANNWVEVASVGNFTVLLNSDGEIYRLGTGVPGSVFTGANASNIPVRVPGPSNFVQISGGQGQVFGLTATGEIWTAGDNNVGLFGNGTTTGSSMTLVKIGNTADNWVAVSGARGTVTMPGAVLAINARGELFAWGSNSNGQTGRGITTGNTTVPTRVGTASNWVDVRLLSVAVVALNSNGELFSWGNNVDGRTGLGITTGNTTVPTRVGTASNWVAIAGGFTHVLAFNDSNELWGWGLNAQGQLGLGHSTSPQSTPRLITETYGFADAARGGGTHSMMLIRIDPAEDEFPLEKILLMPKGTPMPDLNFTFTFEKISFDESLEHASLLPDIPDRVLHINSASDSASDGYITAAKGEVNVLEGIRFVRAGVHLYIVKEVSGSSATLPPGQVVYSDAEYEMRITVDDVPGRPGTLQVSSISIVPLVVDNDSQTAGSKTENLVFTNSYSCSTAGTSEYPGALVISKKVTGELANHTTGFAFEVMLTAHELCPYKEEPVLGTIFGANNQIIGEPISFLSKTPVTVSLAHGQKLVFEELTIGTNFEVTELATPEAIASAELFADGEIVDVEPNEYPDTALYLGSYLIGPGRNTADFTNDYLFPVPTGLRTDSTLALPLAAVAVIVAVLLTCKTGMIVTLWQ
ncbi:MAG: hypothetical protein FWE48_04195 [Coriobacteriia bacterium]|nr:hypothetical protein [Coriobacteriia bacterium]